MYQLNLQNIIRKLPEKTNNKSSIRYVSKLTSSNISTIKSVKSLIRTISIVALAVFTITAAGCEEPGSIGGGFLDDDAGLETRTISVGSIEEYSTNAYTGRLRYMAMGSYDDPLFGEFTSVAIIKPSISTANFDAIEEGDSFKLRLVFSSTVYGDSTSASGFDVYRVSENWRGNELRFGDTLPYDETQKIGEFSVAGTETVEIELDDSWVADYNEYLTSDDEDREVRYRDEFPGLAIVPSGGSSKVLFANVLPASGEDDSDLEFVRFILDREEDDEDENGENDEEDDSRLYQTLRDWGGAETRLASGVEQDGHILHNKLDKMIRLEPELNEERLGSKNLANVQLVFYKDRTLLEATLPGGHTRPEVARARIHRIDSGNINDWIFSRTPDLIADLETSDDSFRFDITNYANSVLFDTPRAGQFYLSIETVNGLVFSTVLFDETAPEEQRPKIIITSVKSGDE